MSQFNDTGYKSFTSSGTVTANTLVKLSSAGVVATAGLAETAIGVAVQTVATGLPVTVRLRGPTVRMKASGTFSVGASVYGRASGQIDDVSTSSADLVGIALEACTAANDIVEVMLLPA